MHAPLGGFHHYCMRHERHESDDAQQHLHQHGESTAHQPAHAGDTVNTGVIAETSLYKI